ncbi:hypothetical protein C8024_14275 [Sphingopyxis sp. BSNA05]|uniref:hypothetical protein n=1 Tax=Sphingopyxis sp. BSNA05 TaxID=1236614 RepID=UPI0015650E07|nr:hypothetical protein [Sphingopyxis sp. BSNA05]NRD90378.1 hypothetical protein [Sphingopyxis sp. BSNA05]
MRVSIAKGLLWLVLALPGILMLWSFSQGDVLAMDMLHPSGEMSVRLMILAMLPGPLSEFSVSTAFSGDGSRSVAISASRLSAMPCCI